MNQTAKAQHGLSKVKMMFKSISIKKILPYLCLIVAIGLPLSVFLYYSPTTPVDNCVTIQYNIASPKKMVVGEEFPILACKIIDGCYFNVLLEDQRWHQVRLTAITSDEATPVVIELLKTSNAPSIILRRKLKESWAVDFMVTTPEKRTTLLEWLREKNLVL